MQWDYCFSTMRPPLCPIPEGNSNLPDGTNTEQELITPRQKSDSTMPFARAKLSGPGSSHGLSQPGENMFRGLTCTPDSELPNNSTGFSYTKNRTGSGKTHTMLGDIEDAEHKLSANRGMTPRVFEHLFTRIHKEEDARRQENLKFVCKCSFLEIYNEQVADLLEPSSTNLQMREDAKKGVYVENLSEVEVKGVNDIVKLLLQGAANRKVAATNMNRASSRSHSVFTCIIESKWECQSVTHHRFGRLNLVDLAGSESCAMETLSTLKFAQRAKFIRNNATVNENATGDVITLKIQIQQLKEEVTHLRGKLNGEAEHTQEDDYGNINLLSSPRSHAWDSRGGTSPLLGYKKAPRKRDLESALVGALKREQATEMQMKAMAAENEQLKRLVKHREEDAQCGKMMLRFREDKIKRLEAVASDKMSAEDHLLEEKNVLTEELQILRNRLDRNPEVTRFAMENIRLMEQLRRLQEFHEGGEQERMIEQIAVLRDQLLEALDWKLMHEQDPNIANQKEPSEAEFSTSSEESEILQKQVDQHRREAEALRNNLSFCLEAKEKLERRVDDLMIQIEKFKVSNSLKAVEMATSTEDTYLQDLESGVEGLSAQRELKDLVEAISAASQREAEAQGTAIFLAREVEDLRKKLRESVDDNKRLIDMYEKAMQERDEVRKAEKDSQEVQEKLQKQVLLLRHQVEELQKEIDGHNDTFKGHNYANNWPNGINVVSAEAEQTIVLRKEVEDLQLKLQDTSEENDRLLELYEKAMQERDDIRRMLWNCGEKGVSGENVADIEAEAQGCPRSTLIVGNDNDKANFQEHTSVNSDSEEEREVICLRKEVEEVQMKLKDILEENERLIDMYEKAMQEKDEIRKLWKESVKNKVSSEINSNIRCEIKSQGLINVADEQLQTELQETDQGLSLLAEEINGKWN
ncbi:hypothetical protein KI387_002375 [Taxus chinensis]|uniref:Kinesin-like protein n=1 Tax=Taxus chinensis TaxID=29808 RepID=A0AA38GWC7_TAXCH|nr:hypothetical protein KI387_002375 [Taxus chinensis]